MPESFLRCRILSKNAYFLEFLYSFNAYEYEERCDCDFTELPLFDADTDEEFDQVSQEFRLTSPIGDTFDFIVGAFWQSSDLVFSDSINVRDDSVLPNYNPAFNAIRDVSTKRNFDQDSDLWSVFAQGTFHFQDNFHLILGGRFTSEEKEASRRQFHFDDINGVEIPNSGAYALGNGFGTGTVAHLVLAGFQIEAYDEISDDRDETAFTPLVTLQYDFDNGSMVYATFTTGFKSGGFDVRSNAHPDIGVGIPGLEGVFEFEEEEADSFEIGGKFVLADGAAELNAAIYRTEYTDLQTSQFDGTLGFNVTNAGEATSQGIELDGRWRVAEDWTLIGAFAYLDFEYDKFPNGQCYFAQTPNGPFAGDGLCDQKGETREFAPEYTASFTADYATSLTDALEFRGSLDLIYSDDYFASPTLDPNLEQDSYTKVNARVSIGAADGKWDVALVGKNLTDEEVISFGNTLPTTLTLSGNTATAYYAFYDRPRSIAIQGTLRF
jgi:outer membrane receptor protein involved in Fe transport